MADLEVKTQTRFVIVANFGFQTHTSRTNNQVSCIIVSIANFARRRKTSGLTSYRCLSVRLNLDSTRQSDRASFNGNFTHSKPYISKKTGTTSSINAAIEKFQLYDEKYRLVQSSFFLMITESLMSKDAKNISGLESSWFSNFCSSKTADLISSEKSQSELFYFWWTNHLWKKNFALFVGTLMFKESQKVLSLVRYFHQLHVAAEVLAWFCPSRRQSTLY